MRWIGFIIFVLGSLAITGELEHIAFPTAQWFFETSREVPLLHCAKSAFPWFGWMSSAILILCGGWMFIRSWTRGARDPMAARRIRHFCRIKRGYYSLIILCVLIGIAALDQAVVGKRALAVQYQGHWVFPAFRQGEMKNRDFGLLESAPDAPVDYRKLKKIFDETHEGRVILPLIPFDPSGDTLPTCSTSLEKQEGIYKESGSRSPFYGLAARYYDADEGKIHIRYTLRKGVLSGPVDGWDKTGMTVYSAEYKDGKLISEHYNGNEPLEDFLSLTNHDLRTVKYHPVPPIKGHWLGTTSQGYDVLAYLYGGLQVNFKAAFIYLPIIYIIGMTIGMMMGYFGGWFDLMMQRLIEIFSNMPFLFVVIIFSSRVPDQLKGLPVILTILVVFGWMGMTYLMRTAAYRDKERDYISAAKVMGAKTSRILFRHLLPNTVAIIVTLIPFTLSGLIFSLTSLDYLGFGLPPEYATWGRLLNDGLSNLSAPWLVTSTFAVLVGLLVLITFIGEAVREAFDPKKFTYYR